MHRNIITGTLYLQVNRSKFSIIPYNTIRSTSHSKLTIDPILVKDITEDSVYYRRIESNFSPNESDKYILVYNFSLTIRWASNLVTRMNVILRSIQYDGKLEDAILAIHHENMTSATIYKFNPHRREFVNISQHKNGGGQKLCNQQS